MKTVKEVSELMGISIRTLRYYDEIGLLTPAERSQAGYRLYDDKSLEKLRGILFFKEMDMPLERIKDVVNSEHCDYSVVLKEYREILVQKINRLNGVLRVVDDMISEAAVISFEGFDKSDAEKVAEALANREEVLQLGSDEVISEIQELVESNMVEGKVGAELLHIYGSKENYMSAVEESTLHPEVNTALQEELKNIYFAFKDSNGELSKTQELVKRLEDNTKKMYRTPNARYILLKIAEDYLAKGKTAQVLDCVYGEGVTDIIGKAIKVYYGIPIY